MSLPLIIKLIAQQVQVRETVPKAYDLNVPQLADDALSNTVDNMFSQLSTSEEPYGSGSQ